MAFWVPAFAGTTEVLMQLQIDASGSRESIALILSRKFGMTHVNLRHRMVVAEGNPPESPFTKGGLVCFFVCIEALLAPLCKA